MHSLVSKAIIAAKISVVTDSDSQNLYSLANQLGMLPHLHALFKALAPARSKLKAQYNALNLKSALYESCGSNPDLGTELSKNFQEHILNYGFKYLLVDKCIDSIEEVFEDTEDSDFSIEISDFEGISSYELSTKPLHVKISKQFGKYRIFLVSEIIELFQYETPNAQLLSDSGKQFQSQMRLKKRWIAPVWHKVIVDTESKNRIFLIDANSLVKNETSADKATAITHLLSTRYWRAAAAGQWKRVTFFKAIDAIYSNPRIGEVWGGYFYTDTGSRFLPDSSGSGCDLRADPFQIGGQSASKKVQFTKLNVAWPLLAACPKIWLHGSSEMLEQPEKSLPWILVKFSTDETDNQQFLNEVLSNAAWT